MQTSQILLQQLKGCEWELVLIFCSFFPKYFYLIYYFKVIYYYFIIFIFIMLHEFQV